MPSTTARPQGAVLDALPLERVVQLHFVGGRWQDGFFVDSHSQPDAAGGLGLDGEVLARAPVKGVLLERDDNLPPFSELAAELERARTLGAVSGADGTSRVPKRAGPALHGQPTA